MFCVQGFVGSRGTRVPPSEPTVLLGPVVSQEVADQLAGFFRRSFDVAIKVDAEAALVQIEGSVYEVVETVAACVEHGLRVCVEGNWKVLMRSACVRGSPTHNSVASILGMRGGAECDSFWDIGDQVFFPRVSCVETLAIVGEGSGIPTVAIVLRISEGSAEMQ